MENFGYKNLKPFIRRTKKWVLLIVPRPGWRFLVRFECPPGKPIFSEIYPGRRLLRLLRYRRACELDKLFAKAGPDPIVLQIQMGRPEDEVTLTMKRTARGYLCEFAQAGEVLSEKPYSSEEGRRFIRFLRRALRLSQSKEGREQLKREFLAAAEQFDQEEKERRSYTGAPTAKRKERS